MTELREKVREMFWYSYNAYMDNAFPKDELCPISCTGKDTWGSYALTLVDTLDTLVVMGDLAEFERAAKIVINNVRFDIDKNVSVFETNIRIVGGLLSAHFIAEEHFTGASSTSAWRYQGELLAMAVDAATRLLPAFNTPTGIPYGTVNLMHGVPPGETPITSLAGASTHIIEFGLLSKLTGQPVFMGVARTALRALWARRSALDLVGTHIDTFTGQWTHLDSGIGSNQDSFYEYLLKGYMLFNDPDLLMIFQDMYAAVRTHMKKGTWYVDVHMTQGTVTLPWFTALSAFWPGLQVLYGDLGSAKGTMDSFLGLIHQYGFAPEAYHLQHLRPVSRLEANFLRPEMSESLVYLYQATRDPLWIKAGREVLEAIATSAWTPCGYAVILNVSGDRMESFFLSETLKYLYLLFDEDNFIHRGNYVFNTEAHYMPLRIDWMQDETEAFDPLQYFRTTCPLQRFSSILGPHYLSPQHEEPLPHVEVPPPQLATPSPQAAAPSTDGTVSSSDLPSNFATEESAESAESAAASVAPAATAPGSTPSSTSGSPPNAGTVRLEPLPPGLSVSISAPHASPGLAEKIASLLSTIDLSKLVGGQAQAQQPPPPALETTCVRHQEPGSFWGYQVCFGRSAIQAHPSEQDPSKDSIQNSLGHRHIASAVATAPDLDMVQDIVTGFTKDSDAMPNAVFVHEYSQGTPCGEEGHRRRATVGYFCDASLSPGAFKMAISEPSFCYYALMLYSSLVC